MKKLTTIFVVILFAQIILTSCGSGSGKETGSNSNDTVFIHLSESVSTQEQLFNYVKANDWKPVYVFQIDNEDDFGNIKWDNFSMITDFSKEEFEEMKKYANVYSYLEKCPNATDKYSITKINR